MTENAHLRGELQKTHSLLSGITLNLVDALGIISKAGNQRIVGELPFVEEALAEMLAATQQILTDIYGLAGTLIAEDDETVED